MAGNGRRPTAPAEAVPRSAPEAELAALRKRVRKQEEPEILRKAAKYFAGETRW